jgi:hypothetical protein
MAEIATPKGLEAAIKAELAERQKRQPMLFERIVDSAAAGNLIGKTPADFYVLHSSRFSYIEAKFSSSAETLRATFANAVKSHQLASARLAARAGGSYWIVFYSGVSKRFELWDGLYCANQRSKGSPLALPERKLIVPDLETVMDRILLNPRGTQHV